MGKSIGALNHDDLSISPIYKVSDWTRARDGDDWALMTAIFNDRIESRYLKPIRLIASDSDIGEFSGFSVLAIDCLIIETLNQFYLGLDETEGEHRKAFWNFFKGSKHFKNHFTRKIAFTFYSHFRCGILHQAQTKLKSVVRIDRDEMVKPVSKLTKEGLIIDRVKFHSALESEISDYKSNLIENNNDLRKNFIVKMNYICGIQA